jgi:hypothetical protein
MDREPTRKGGAPEPPDVSPVTIVLLLCYGCDCDDPANPRVRILIASPFVML